MAKGAGAVNGNDIREVAELFAGVSDRQEMLRLLDEILTPAELHDLALRWRLVQRLHAGVPQRRIAGELGISLCKITRGSRILKQPNGVIRGILERRGKGPAGLPAHTPDARHTARTPRAQRSAEATERIPTAAGEPAATA